MICCINCFQDLEIKFFIRNLGTLGTCPICRSRDVFIYDTNHDITLCGYFEEFLNIYTPSGFLPTDYPRAEMIMLKDEIFQNWNIFNNLSSTQIYNIITGICNEKYTNQPDLFDSPVGITELHDDKYLNDHSLVYNYSWEMFVDYIKTLNRFHTNILNLGVLSRICSYISKAYKKGSLFYRGRISTSDGFDCDSMGAPPYDKATVGRVNAEGIRCLYLADDVLTTIHEIRAGKYDYVSIGKFELLHDIVVVDLKLINSVSPFIGLDCKEYAINREHFNKINTEMSKSLRRSDSPLDYVPTQYISDHIKSMLDSHGIALYHGIEYKSTMNPDGFNLAIFYPDYFKCIDVDVYEIDKLEYGKRRL